MAVDTQHREPLYRAVQQFDAQRMAQVVSLQIQDFTAAGAMGAEFDVAMCDATGGAFTLDLPIGVDVYVGKEYVVKETSGANAVTVRGYGGTGTIDGGSSIVVAAREAMAFVATAVSAAGAVTWRVLSQTLTAGGDPTAIHVNVAGEIHAITAKAVPVAADEIVGEDSAASWAKKRFTLGSLPVTQAQVSSVVLQPAADAAVEIDATVAGVQLTVSAASPVVISTNANCYPGQKVHLFAVAVAGGGSYTLALDVGTLTLNATGEGAVVMRNAGDTAWVCVGLSGATIV